MIARFRGESTLIAALVVYRMSEQVASASRRRFLRKDDHLLLCL